MPKISQLEAATDITASDLMQVVDIEDTGMAPSGTNKKVTAQLLANELANIVSNGSINPAKLSSGALPTGITATATGSITARTLANRFADVVNVKDFGAVGDGVADDTNAIQSALNVTNSNGGGEVFVPAGTYKISSTLTIGSKTKFAGVGSKSVIRTANGAVQKQHVIINKNTSTGNSEIIISDLYLDANGANASFTYSGPDSGFDCLILVRCSDSVVNNVWATGALRTGTFPSVSRWGEGIEMHLGSRNKVTNCKCFNNKYDGIKSRSEQYLEVTGNHCWDNARAGIQFAFAGSESGFGGTGTEDNKSSGTLYYTIANNTISHSTGTPGSAAPVTSGIYLHPASYGTIEGNVVDGVQQGFGTWGATENNLISNNTFRIRGTDNSNSAGIAFSGSGGGAKKNTVIGNSIIGLSGASRQYIRDGGNSDIFRSNRFILEGGSGTWTLEFTGSNALYRGNDQSSYVVADSGTSNVVYLDESTQPSVTTLTDEATISWNVSSNPVAKVTLGGNRTLSISGIEDGTEYRLLITQDATGSRLLDFGSSVIWSGETAPTLTTTASKSDLIIFRSYNGILLGSSILNYDAPITGFTSFSGASGTSVTGYTPRWVTTNVTWDETSSGFLRHTSTSSGRQALSWDAAPSKDNIEILGKLRTSVEASDSSRSRIVARGSGSAGSESGIAVGLGDINNIAITEYVSGTPTNLGSGGSGEPFSWSVNTWYWVRLRLIGSSVKVKVWQDGQSEPSSWLRDTTTSLTSSGWIGVFAFSTGSNDDWDYLSYATAGGTAP